MSNANSRHRYIRATTRNHIPTYMLVAFYDFGGLGRSYNAADNQIVLDLSSAGNNAVRGAGGGVGVDDPALHNAWLKFDGADDLLSSIPAKAAAWTIVNADASHCMGVDSAGGSFYDGLWGGGATEFGVRVAGGYNGYATAFLQYDRVLLPWEHMRIYRCLMSMMMAKGLSPIASGSGWGSIGPPAWGDWDTPWGT